MAQQLPTSLIKKDFDSAEHKNRKPWHRPLLTFMPLHVTGADSGTTSDGQLEENQQQTG